MQNRKLSVRKSAIRTETASKKRPIKEEKKAATSIRERDQKILWARAAGRCSMSDCRVILTLDKDIGNPATLGAMCHIIGEKENSPRGHSPLSDIERNSYPNLILLCSHHHDIIDEDVEKYPIEVLHKIKTEHELWVAESLGNTEPDPDELVYSDLIDTISAALRLDQWSWFVDHAVRNLIHGDFLDARGVLNAKLLDTTWPKKRPILTRAIKDVIRAFSDFITYYESNAEPKMKGDFFGPDHSYKRFINPRYAEYAEYEEYWSTRCFWLLCNYVVKLNKFVDAVQQYSNPMFYRVHGHFLVLDELGYRSDGQSTIYLPTTNAVEKGLARLETEHKKAARKRPKIRG